MLSLTLHFWIINHIWRFGLKSSRNDCKKKRVENIRVMQKFTAPSFALVYNNSMIDTTTRVQILDETDCISHCTNTLGKGMNPIILPPAMGK